MMARKKRRAIIILVVLLILAIIAGVFTLLYLKTDLFKSSKTLFVKYLGQTTNHLEGYVNKVTTNDYITKLNENKYITDTNIDINYKDGNLTQEESTNNQINTLKIGVSGQVDKPNNYRYNNIKLNQNDEKIAELEYVKDNSKYGIRFSDLFKQYLLVDDNSFEDLMRKIKK